MKRHSRCQHSRGAGPTHRPAGTPHAAGHYKARQNGPPSPSHPATPSQRPEGSKEQSGEWWRACRAAESLPPHPSLRPRISTPVPGERRSAAAPARGAPSPAAAGKRGASLTASPSRCGPRERPGRERRGAAGRLSGSSRVGGRRALVWRARKGPPAPPGVLERRELAGRPNPRSAPCPHADLWARAGCWEERRGLARAAGGVRLRLGAAWREGAAAPHAVCASLETSQKVSTSVLCL